MNRLLLIILLHAIAFSAAYAQNSQGKMSIGEVFVSASKSLYKGNVQVSANNGLIYCGVDGLGTYTFNFIGIGSTKNKSKFESIHLNSYPNPFTSETVVSFIMPDYGTVNLDIYDVFGKKVYQTEKSFIAPGQQTIVVNYDAMGIGTFIGWIVVNGEPVVSHILVKSSN